MRAIGGSAAALRHLAYGKASAREIADVVGWAPRTAGPKMRSLERQGFVMRVVVKPATVRSRAKYEWLLTAKGWDVVRP